MIIQRAQKQINLGKSNTTQGWNPKLIEKLVYPHPEGKRDKAINLIKVDCTTLVVVTQLRLLFYSDKLLLTKQVNVQSFDRCITQVSVVDPD